MNAAKRARVNFMETPRTENPSDCEPGAWGKLLPFTSSEQVLCPDRSLTVR